MRHIFPEVLVLCHIEINRLPSNAFDGHVKLESPSRVLIH